MLQLKNVFYNYPNQNYFKGVGPINLTLEKGKVLAIVGKSGSGKTSLIKCIYGLVDLIDGEIKFNNTRVLGPAFNLIPGNENMSLVSQDFYVLDNHTVEENITDKLIGFTNEYKQQRVNKLLKLLDLQALKNTKARFLSSGQKQRVAIGRALAIIPPLMLLDEPFSNLDAILNTKLFDFVLKEVKKNKTSVILITHQAEEALKYADEVAVLDNGKINQIGNTLAVYYNPKNTKLAGLLGTYSIIHPEDLSKESKLKLKSKKVVRPNQLQLIKTGKEDISVIVESCFFNGKCFEILATTKTENEILLYNNTTLKTRTEIKLKLI